MVHFSPLFISLLSAAVCVHALPLNKRIAQTIADSTTKWVAACTAAGGAEQCNPISVTAFSTLLAAAGPCDQQNSADAMIDLANTLNNDADMIKFAQIFAQQPRNTPTSQAVPYCQTAPKNAELNGLFQCQFQGASETTFVGGIAVGGAGTIPFDMSAPLSPAGSCPANPTGPIADGSQLSDLTQDPGVPAASGSNSAPAATDASASATAVATSAAPAASVSTTGDSNNCSGDDDGDDSDDTTDVVPSATPVAATPVATTAAAVATSAASSSSSFLLQNGQDAQALNAKFATLTADSTCNEGDQACVGTGFAQCVGGKFVVQDCSATLMCAALPLVNKAGTSITCTTQSDALSRIQATGAQGGITGN